MLKPRFALVLTAAMAAWAAGAAGAAPASKPEPPKAARPAAAAPATAAADETGFAPIFNGKDLSGWTGGTKGYAVESGVLVCPKEGGGNIYTDKDYGDFVLRLDFKLTAGGNNGVGIRVPNGGHAAYDGMEIQILDDTADQYRNLKVWQFCGSIYGVAAAEKGHLRPVGEWNAMEITARGRQVTVKLNGATVVDADLDKASAPKTPDEKAHPGLKNKEGRIAFLGHGSRVEFRNIRVKELKGEAGAK